MITLSMVWAVALIIASKYGLEDWRNSNQLLCRKKYFVRRHARLNFQRNGNCMQIRLISLAQLATTSTFNNKKL